MRTNRDNRDKERVLIAKIMGYKGTLSWRNIYEKLREEIPPLEEWIATRKSSIRWETHDSYHDRSVRAIALLPAVSYCAHEEIKKRDIDPHTLWQKLEPAVKELWCAGYLDDVDERLVNKIIDTKAIIAQELKEMGM